MSYAAQLRPSPPTPPTPKRSRALMEEVPKADLSVYRKTMQETGLEEAEETAAKLATLRTSANTLGAKFGGMLRRDLSEKEPSPKAPDYYQGQDIDTSVDSKDDQEKMSKQALGTKVSYPTSNIEIDDDPVLGPFKETISNLKSDEEFMTQLNKMTDKYSGLTEREIFMVAAKESGVGTNMGSAGNMFQILETPAKEAGIDLKKLNKSDNMADHLKALEKYLDRWGYDGDAPLGLVIAAPGFRNASPNTVVYEAGSKEARANPKWLNARGDATVASITEFYRD